MCDHHFQDNQLLYYMDYHKITWSLYVINSQYVVQFIDYGNQSTVAAGNLKNLPQSMLNKPAASVKCHLRDLQVKPGSEQKVHVV